VNMKWAWLMQHQQTVSRWYYYSGFTVYSRLLLLRQHCCNTSSASPLPFVYSICHKLSIRVCKKTFQIPTFQLYIKTILKITCTKHTRSDYGKGYMLSIASSPLLCIWRANTVEAVTLRVRNPRKIN
jgi:hypothetical protein